MREVPHKVFWQELLFGTVCFQIGLYSQYQIVAERCPSVVLGFAVAHVSKARSLPCLRCVADLACDIFCQNVTGSCRAVVVEAVVPVCCVTWFAVLLYCGNDSHFLFFPQVQYLLVYPPSLVRVLVCEIAERRYAHHIVRHSEDEPCDEKALPEREHAVVHHCIGLA